MKSIFVVLCSLVAGSGLSAAQSVEHCRQLPDPVARLKCYDEIPVAGGRPAGASPAGRPEGTPAARASQNSPAPASPEFGFESRSRPPSTPAAADSIESTIPGPFDGWTGSTRFRLANGQVWEIRDSSEAAYRLLDPKVRISRGISGSFFLHIEGVAQTPRVRRVQ